MDKGGIKRETALHLQLGVPSCWDWNSPRPTAPRKRPPWIHGPPHRRRRRHRRRERGGRPHRLHGQLNAERSAGRRVVQAAAENAGAERGGTPPRTLDPAGAHAAATATAATATAAAARFGSGRLEYGQAQQRSRELGSLGGPGFRIGPKRRGGPEWAC